LVSWHAGNMGIFDEVSTGLINGGAHSVSPWELVQISGTECRAWLLQSPD
jgi:hypothetical protein